MDALDRPQLGGPARNLRPQRRTKAPNITRPSQNLSIWSSRRRPRGSLASSPQTFASRLTALRQQAGLTKTALAGSHYSVSYVSLIEAGRRRPSPEALHYFAERLGVSPSYLRTGIPDDVADQAAYQLEEARHSLIAGDPNDAYARLRPVLDAIEEHGLETLKAPALRLAGDTLAHLRRIREAIDHYEEALEHRLPPHDHGIVAAALARAYAGAGDLAYAAEIAEKHLHDTREQPPDPTVVAELNTVLVAIYFERGDTTKAEQAARRALTAAEGANPHAKANALWASARILADQKNWQEALNTANRARVLIEEANDHQRLAVIHNACAFLCLEHQPPRTDEAQHHLDTAESLLGPDGPPTDRAHIHTERGRLALLQGRPETALRLSHLALELTDEDRLEHARSLHLRGRALAALDRPQPAIEALQQAIGVFTKSGARQPTATCWQQIAELQLGQGDTEAGIQAFREAIEVLNLTGSQAWAYEPNHGP